MSHNTAKPTDPIWDSRNSDEPQALPQAGEVWGNNSPVFNILKVDNKLVLATICIEPDAKSFTADELLEYMQKRGYKRLGSIQIT